MFNFKKETHEFYITFYCYEMISRISHMANSSKLRDKLYIEYEHHSFLANDIIHMLDIQNGHCAKIKCKLLKKEIPLFEDLMNRFLAVTEHYEFMLSEKEYSKNDFGL